MIHGCNQLPSRLKFQKEEKMKFQKELTVAAVTSMLIFGFSARSAEAEPGTGEKPAVTAPAEKCGQHEGCDHKDGDAMKGGCGHKDGEVGKGGCGHEDAEAPAAQ